MELDDAIGILLKIAESAYKSEAIDKFCGRILPDIVKMAEASGAFFYVAAGPRTAGPYFFVHGLDGAAGSHLEEFCRDECQKAGDRAEPHCAVLPLSSSNVSGPSGDDCRFSAVILPMVSCGRCLGILGYAHPGESAAGIPSWAGDLARLVGSATEFQLAQYDRDREIRYLNAYLNVSSLLAQSMGLSELVEKALYSCMEVVSAEAASVMLLDHDHSNFSFYVTEGPAKGLLTQMGLPADKGVAGHVLRTQQSEIVNDVTTDPRFYGKIDSESGFHTRNLIAIPLTAGEERVGVLEVLNKANGDRFTEQECALLVSIAEEIAFAIRNARVFEYVVDTYCKQRQGQKTCRGCRRPLRSWTPCVRYREAELSTIPTAHGDSELDREKAMRFERPQNIPIVMGLAPALWSRHREKLEDLVMRHPVIFGPHKRGSRDFDAVEPLTGPDGKAGEYVDVWGCVWSRAPGGEAAYVSKHPFPDREMVQNLKPPQPGDGLPHGCMFLRLTYLRGYEEAMIDFFEEPPELNRLIDTVLEYNLSELREILRDKPKIVEIADDLGTQRALPISPQTWRKHLKPCYAKLFGACREAGAAVLMQTDGHIVPIIRDLAECGADVLSVQIGPNGLDQLAEECRGRLCLSPSIDGQFLASAQPAQIDECVAEIARKIAVPQGGLWFRAECDGDVPLENIEALCQAFERYRTCPQ
ncbi:MAG: GAF domain-containing protein [Planctomycetaceae bacterium]|nr:GAF domain-containing protein [Planctomycetaceae bacterium]